MSVELECTAQGCDHEDGGAKYKTQALVPDIVLVILDMHRADRHGVRGAEGGGAASEDEGGGQLVRPSISSGCSQEEFELFKMAWTMYVMENEVHDNVLMCNQLLSCLDRESGRP